jgi:hypothetical protein
MSKGYTSKEALQNYILQNIEDTFNAQIEQWILGVEKLIDQITGRTFVADAVASERYFDGDESGELMIDDCVEITKVELGQDDFGGTFKEVPATGSNRYFKYPVNKDNKGNTLPYSKIILNTYIFPDGIQNNRITAKWGYSAACPDDIALAATVFLAGIVNQQRGGGGDQIKSESIGNYQVTYNSDNGNDSWADFENAKAILNAYKKYII